MLALVLILAHRRRRRRVRRLGAVALRDGRVRVQRPAARPGRHGGGARRRLAWARSPTSWRRAAWCRGPGLSRIGRRHDGYATTLPAGHLPLHQYEDYAVIVASLVRRRLRRHHQGDLAGGIHLRDIASLGRRPGAGLLGCRVSRLTLTHPLPADLLGHEARHAPGGPACSRPPTTSRPLKAPATWSRPTRRLPGRLLRRST